MFEVSLKPRPQSQKFCQPCSYVAEDCGCCQVHIDHEKHKEPVHKVERQLLEVERSKLSKESDGVSKRMSLDFVSQKSCSADNAQN